MINAVNSFHHSEKDSACTHMLETANRRSHYISVSKVTTPVEQLHGHCEENRRRDVKPDTFMKRCSVAQRQERLNSENELMQSRGHLMCDLKPIKSKLF